jgi:hypothetical protein
MYHYDTRTRIKFAAGRYHQFIDFISFGEGASFMDMWMPYDGSVPVMYADQLVLGFEHDPQPDLEFTTELYYNQLHNVHGYDMSIDRGSDMESAFLIGEGNAYGAEFMLRRKAGRLTGWLGYSLAWSKRRFEGTYLNFGNEFYPKWDRRHDFISVATYKLTKKWDISSSWRYNTGQGYTRAMGIMERQIGNIPNDYYASKGYVLIYGAKNNYRLPADHRLDMAFAYNHKFFGKDAKLNISIYNVYSRRSIWFKNYSIEIPHDGSETPQVREEDIKLLPILPLINYEVRF